MLWERSLSYTQGGALSYLIDGATLVKWAAHASVLAALVCCGLGGSCLFIIVAGDAWLMVRLNFLRGLV